MKKKEEEEEEEEEKDAKNGRQGQATKGSIYSSIQGQTRKNTQKPRWRHHCIKDRQTGRYEFQDKDAFTRSALFTGCVRSRRFPRRRLGNPIGNRQHDVQTIIMTVQKTRRIKKSNIIIGHQTT
jgi:hypothetical protein